MVPDALKSTNIVIAAIRIIRIMPRFSSAILPDLMDVRARIMSTNDNFIALSPEPDDPSWQQILRVVRAATAAGLAKSLVPVRAIGQTHGQVHNLFLYVRVGPGLSAVSELHELCVCRLKVSTPRDPILLQARLVFTLVQMPFNVQSVVVYEG